MHNRPAEAPKVSEDSKLAEGFRKVLSTKLGEVLPMSSTDDTFEIDADTFFLSFVIEDETFEIRSIESRRKGLGSKIVNLIKAYCAQKHLDVCANQVKDTAEGFWEKMGFEEGSDGRYYLHK